MVLTCITLIISNVNPLCSTFGHLGVFEKNVKILCCFKIYFFAIEFYVSFIYFGH